MILFAENFCSAVIFSFDWAAAATALPTPQPIRLRSLCWESLVAGWRLVTLLSKVTEFGSIRSPLDAAVAAQSPKKKKTRRC